MAVEAIVGVFPKQAQRPGHLFVDVSNPITEAQSRLGVHPLKRVLLGFGVVAALIMGMGSSASAQTSKPRVLVVGDSITHMAKNQITNALRPDFAAGIHAINETPMSYWSPFLAKNATPGARLDWVIELGTDDGPTHWQANFTHEVNQLSSQQCVILVTVNTRYRSYGQSLDREMQQTAAAKPNFHVVDWGNIEFDQSGWLQSDGIHPTKAGSIELAQLERSALLKSCPA